MKMIQKGLFRVCFQPITMLNCCTTCISWEIGSYNTQQSRHNEHTHFCRNFVAKSAIWFSENEGGGQRPFGTFPKINPFWWRHLSLMLQNCKSRSHYWWESSTPSASGAVVHRSLTSCINLHLLQLQLQATATSTILFRSTSTTRGCFNHVWQKEISSFPTPN